MCWYSQYEMVSTRNAVEGEELVLREMPNRLTRWVVSPQDPQTAVCLPHGCNLRLTGIPEDLQAELHVGAEAVAEFREVYAPPRKSLLARIFLDPLFCRDVLLFSNSHFIAVSRLPLEMRLDVLSSAVIAPVGKEEQGEETPVFADVPRTF